MGNDGMAVHEGHKLIPLNLLLVAWRRDRLRPTQKCAGSRRNVHETHLLQAAQHAMEAVLLDAVISSTLVERLHL